ncbi:MAG: molybdate transport system substrate-binding protein [Acidobacteriota bacterium]|jgi:molybdate transport system substrate-binding protein|nr:molybdate transport system substrate-binding protein [Acidobacteriota bacterium]
MNERKTLAFQFIIHHSAFIIFFSLLFSAFFISCSSHRNSQDKQADSAEITVAAAANLTDAFTELGQRFTAQTGIRVRYSFGATADLEKQIENGAPFDVFASADVEHVDKLKSQGLLTPQTDNIYARGRLILWIPPGSSLTLNRIEDITRADVARISIAKPDLAPYGRATIEALRALNLWQQVEPKVIYGQNVSQTKQYAATGNAEVAFLPMALVKPNEGHSIEVDERLHQPIDQAIAVIKDSPQQQAARRFVDFVLSPEGQALLEQYGYRKTVMSDE